MYHLLLTHCHKSLQTQILLDSEYKTMATDKEYYNQKNATTLLAIIKSFCNGAVVVENLKRTVFERLYNVLFIKGDNYGSLQEYATVFEQCAEVGLVGILVARSYVISMLLKV